MDGWMDGWMDGLVKDRRKGALLIDLSNMHQSANENQQNVYCELLTGR